MRFVAVALQERQPLVKQHGIGIHGIVQCALHDMLAQYFSTVGARLMVETLCNGSDVLPDRGNGQGVGV